MLWQGDIMKRKIYNHLLEWKNLEDRKPILSICLVVKNMRMLFIVILRERKDLPTFFLI